FDLDRAMAIAIGSRFQVGAADLEQIKFLLGHLSIQTTERYLGTEQEIALAINDKLGCKRWKALDSVLAIIRAMAIKDVLALLDSEIATLKEVRRLLKADSTRSDGPRKAGRPRKADSALLTAVTTTAKTK